MREHPIPQDVTGYRFHIIGSMTLKQFAEIFLGVIVAIIIYNTNLPAPIRWAFILISVGLGAAAAFVPIAERPLDHWIITFFKVLYKPTQFYWRRDPKIPESFLYKPRTNQEVYEPEVDLAPARRQRIKEYLTSVNTPSEYQSDLTQWESDKVQQILGVFETEQVVIQPTPVAAPAQLAKPKLDIRVRSLRVTSADVVRSPDEVTIYGTASMTQAVADNAPVQQLSFTAAAPNIPEARAERSQLAQTRLKSDQIASAVEIPETQAVAAQAAAPDELQQSDQAQVPATAPDPGVVFMTHQNQDQSQAAPTTNAAFNTSLPFPDTPDEPNKVVGMVLTPNNDLITNAIVEVQTLDGQIVRAVKTNALGQFFITTPLKDGEYNLIVEKPGFQFTAQHLTLSGEPLAPLEIRSL